MFGGQREVPAHVPSFIGGALSPARVTVLEAPHRFGLRVYYEDTDLAGVVYYANYLRFIERARTEWARSRGIDQARLRSEAGIVFAVRRVEADYLSPARFDDWLQVTTAVAERRPARLVLRQEVRREAALLFGATVTLVALGSDGRPRRLPAALGSRGAAGGAGGSEV